MMNTNEAEQILSNFNDAVVLLLNKASQYDSMKENESTSRITIPVLQKEIKDLKKENINLKRHLSAFRHNATYDICPDCDGSGMIQYENEYGCEAEPCSLCQETGIIDKKVLEELEATKPKPTPTVFIDESEDELPW